MRVSIRSGLVALLAAGVAPLAGVHAQAPATKNAAPPAAKGAAPAPAPASANPAAPAVAPARPANLDQVLATVNGEKITRADLLDFLSRYDFDSRIPPEQIYRDAVDTLINTRLVGQFLNRQQIPAPPEQVQEGIAQVERGLKADGRDLQTALQEGGQTMDDLRREITNRVRWVEYLKIKGTDAELKRFAATHKDLVNGTQVRASHIYLQVPRGATPADKEKIRQKLLALKQDIVGKKISFAEAANKNSEDPGSQEGTGGDLGYFGLNSGLLEEFANAAFAMKPGQISDPVETAYGLHLIQVTDRKEGTPVDFEQQKPFILQMYAADLQKQVLTAERKRAEEAHSIDIKPMPPDLFPPAPPAQTPAPAPTPGGTPPARGNAAPDAARPSTPK